MTTGIILFAHGSRVESANEAVRAVAADLARASAVPLVQAAFLELGLPDLEGAVGILKAKGADRIVIVPYFLTLGLHMERDLPRLVSEISSRYEGIQIAVTPPLDGHPGLVEVLLDRVKQAGA